MNCNVVPLSNYSKISYRVKCVDVVNERAFGDLITNETGSFQDYHAESFYADELLHLYRRKPRNLMQQTLESPDFMVLNTKENPGCITETREFGEKVFRSLTTSIEKAIPPPKNTNNGESLKKKTYPSPMRKICPREEETLSSLVDQLLLDIYGLPRGDRPSETVSTTSSSKPRSEHRYLQGTRLRLKSVDELHVLVDDLQERIDHVGGLLVRQLRRRDYLVNRRNKRYDVVTAHLQARSEKRSEDTRMKFSVIPQPGESGFTQWLDAMKMVAKLQGGIPPEFRKRLWLTLAERHLEQRRVDWKQAEKLCFNEWSNPDDEELGIQIVKDLHRTGCSLFCGAAGRDNQAVLRRVLLGFARWNKSVGYCQGLNVLAALVLQVVDRAESSAVKVMIYLIEGVLPEGYFADNLRGLSVDMAVFRDLLRMRLPKLSRHLEALQSDAKDKATGSSYEPPLTNVFTMQWFLTLFCHCLPQEAVLRVWDLIFLEGDEVLLKTALAIWEGLSDRIMTVTSADEFYSIMGVLTREMLEFTDTNNLIKAIVSMGPLTGVTDLREKHRYNITPWARRLSDDEDSDAEEDERIVVAAAMFGINQRMKKDRATSSLTMLHSMGPSSDRERLALDISTLKHQYAKLRERQRQAHIILSAACARQSMVAAPTSQAMNHLLVGKSALISGKNRQLSPPPGSLPPKPKSVTLHSPRTQNRRDRQGITLHWKDTKKRKERMDERPDAGEVVTEPAHSSEGMSGSLTSPKRGPEGSKADSDSDSTSTELCDEPDKLSDLDSEEQTSASDYVMATDEEKKSPRGGDSPSMKRESVPGSVASSQEDGNRCQESLTGEVEVQGPKITVRSQRGEDLSDLEETSIAEITDQIRRLSADDEVYAGLPLMDNKSDLGSSGMSVSRRDSKSLDDWSESSKSDAGKSRSVKGDSLDVGIDGTSETSLATVDSFNFLSLSGSREDDEGTRENNSKYLEVGRVSSDDARSLVEHIDVGKNDVEQSDAFPENVGVEKDGVYSDSYDAGVKHLPGLFPTSVSASFDRKEVDGGGRSPTLRSYEKSLQFCGSDSRDSEILGTSAIAIRTNYASPDVSASTVPKSYAIGHIPITPVLVDQKLSKTMESSGTSWTSLREETPSPGMTCFERNGSLTSPIYKQQPTPMKSYPEQKKSPKTPDSGKSFDSGETMGPDSKTSSLNASPRTPPTRSESRTFRTDKSACSSVSSDSKTLTLRSIDLDPTNVHPTRLEAKKTSYEKSSPSTPISSDSLKNKSDASLKLVVSSSSDSCSPEKLKSSDRSFSSELQSPISANSIKYTSNCKGGPDNPSESPLDLSAATSPFYPIAHPNQKTPSPYSVSKQKNGTDSAETSPEMKSTSSKESTKPTGYRQNGHQGIPKNNRGNELGLSDSQGYRKVERRFCKGNQELESTRPRTMEKDVALYESEFQDESRQRSRKSFVEDDLRDVYSEKDTVAPLPIHKVDKRSLLGNRCGIFQTEKTTERQENQEYSKPFERSYSSLDKSFADLKGSIYAGNFDTSTVKKRSSDILEDIKHLESKTTADSAPDTGILTKKTGYILEDLKDLEARRQDTFSDSASGLSKCRLDALGADFVADRRKSYVVEPKINIDENSDSILKSLALNNDGKEDDKESKLGVWTKVKPRKRGNDGRRSSSDRALKIIQENSAILHKILTCQAKKRLPDLEEISKEITISPINEEISKIFSPILERIGLNEEEINEELARINLKDFDQMAATGGSEFDAKINDELSRLSLIDDSEVDHLRVDDIVSRDYLETRDALIDRQINEELSKLLANYEERSGMRDARSSSQNVSDLEALDFSSGSTNVFSYKSNDSIETKGELESVEANLEPEKFSPFLADDSLMYGSSGYNGRDLSAKSDIDIYRELEKLDKISAAQVFPRAMPYVSKAIPYASNPVHFKDASPIEIDYSRPEKPFDSSPSRSPYDDFKPYDFKSRISPRKGSKDPYSSSSREKSAIEPTIEPTFEYTERLSATSPRLYDLGVKRQIVSKESLEFRVRYDDEQARQIRTNDLTLRPFQTELEALDKGAPYYNDDSTINKYTPKGKLSLAGGLPSQLDYVYEKPEGLGRNYEELSPEDYKFTKSKDLQRQAFPSPLSDKEPNFGSYLSLRLGDSRALSTNYHLSDRKFPDSGQFYAPKLSPSLEDVAKRPVSHPEFPDKPSASKFPDSSSSYSASNRKSSLSLGNIGHPSKIAEQTLEKILSPKMQFSPFPVRNTVKKPKELGLKLGLYSPTNSNGNALKRS
ncbi:uncharacterized protein LOC105694437 [Orussus abietinus]|uniref:uncharacterized protein LOC105694437 n=1 Tax=Orussus abietinus TaxID=222816 RepID=UPI000C71616D|nr:uncharacterized protein LOC105694437 [Orussus abietinus]